MLMVKQQSQTLRGVCTHCTHCTHHALTLLLSAGLVSLLNKDVRFHFFFFLLMLKFHLKILLFVDNARARAYTVKYFREHRHI